MNELIINVEPLETRVALMEDKHLAELTIDRHENRSLVGNIYKGRVDSVVPGIQAAFVDIGFEKNGFLYVADIAVANVGEVDFEEGTAKVREGGRRRRIPHIEKILKKNQFIMVQVAKDTLGTKGVRLTNYVTLPGRYVVLMPTVNHVGVSRKIEDDRERDRLRRILHQVRPDGIGLICRTAAEKRTKAELEADVKYLAKVWTKIKNRMESMKGPCLIHEDLGPILRVVRDSFGPDVDKLLIDDEAQYSRVLNFLETYAPNLKKRCRLYRNRRPIFDRHGVDDQIQKALQRKVYLKNGGHICIDQTEALIAIDVNTGRFTGSKHLEETVLQTNLEAADEIARQARLRDLGGIIVIDFIDMRYERNRKQLIKRLTDALKRDRAKNTISELSELGMIEMTRKRVKHDLMRTLSQPCPNCEGSGMVRSITTMTLHALRELRALFCDTREKRVILQVHADVARRLRNENKELLDEVTKQFDREISVESVSDFHIHDIRFLSARTREELARKTKK